MRFQARLLAAVAPWAALTVLATGAPAASTPGEAVIRGQVVAAAHEAVGAESLMARGVAYLGPGRGGRLAPIYRLEALVEQGEELRTDDRRFPPDRWTRSPTNEVVTVGEGAWWRTKDGRYREATIDPTLAEGVLVELADLERAAKVGRDLKKIGAAHYELTAPATAFNGPEGAHGPLRLVVALTAAGQLRRLRRIETQDGIGVVLAETFTGFDRAFGIAAPPAGAIAPGPVQHIATSDGFSKLLGPGPFEGD